MTKRPSKYNGEPIPYGMEFESLCEIASVPGVEAWAACIAIGHQTDKTAFEFLEKLAVSDDWRYRRIAIEAMAFHPLALERADYLCGFLNDPSPEVVRTACQVVAELDFDEAHDHLISILNVRTADTRSVILGALNILWQPSDFDVIVSVSQNDTSKRVRRQAAEVLRNNADPQNWEQLFDIWRHDSFNRHRTWACELAGMFGDTSAINMLSDMQTDTNKVVRKAASRAVQKLSQ